MPALSESPISPDELFPHRQRFTRADVEFLIKNHRLTGRYELIDGEVVTKMPQNLPHRLTLLLVAIWLEQVFGRAFVESQQSVRIGKRDAKYNLYEPDILVHEHSALEQTANEPNPADIVLVVEVADSTLASDRSKKADVYARSGYREYWIADVNAKQIFVHRDPTPNGYNSIVVYSGDDQISPFAKPNAKTAVNALFPADNAQN